MILAYLPDQNLGHVDNFGLANNNGGVRALLDWPDIPPDEATAPDRQFLVALYSRKTTARSPAGPILAAEILDDWREMAHWSQMPRHDQREPTTTSHSSRKRAGSCSTSRRWSAPRPGPVARTMASFFGSATRITMERTGPATSSSAAKGPASGRNAIRCSWSWTPRSPSRPIRDRGSRDRRRSPTTWRNSPPGRSSGRFPFPRTAWSWRTSPTGTLATLTTSGSRTTAEGSATLLDWPDIPPDEASKPDRQFLVALYSRQTTSHPKAGPIHASEILEDWREMAHWSQCPDSISGRRQPMSSSRKRAGSCSTSRRWSAPRPRPVARIMASCFGSGTRTTTGADWSGYDVVSREGAGEWANRRPMLLVVKAAKSAK